MTRNTYFQSIEAFKDKQVIKVLTGIRRCGKSVLMEQFMQSLLERGVSERQITYIRLDDLDNELLLEYHNLSIVQGFSEAGRNTFQLQKRGSVSYRLERGLAVW